MRIKIYFSLSIYVKHLQHIFFYQSLYSYVLCLSLFIFLMCVSICSLFLFALMSVCEYSICQRIFMFVHLLDFIVWCPSAVLCIYLSVYLMHLSIYLSVRLWIHLSICVAFSNSNNLYVRLCIVLSICAYESICISVYLSINTPFN